MYPATVSVIRKPSRKTTLFKFMTVLKPEVWLSIVGALTVTAFMIWLLDKYSPYSAQNNKTKYEQFRYRTEQVGRTRSSRAKTVITTAAVLPDD